jgi:hypothetical protein
MAGVDAFVDAMVSTFGPFLIPVTVFAIGVLGYAILFLVTRALRGGEEAGAVNLSAGTPEESTVEADHGAARRGLVPEDPDGESDREGPAGGNGGDERADGERSRQED